LYGNTLNPVMEAPIQSKSAAKAVIQSRAQLATLLGVTVEFIATVSTDPNRFYSEFEIIKPNGESRPIKPPCKALRHLQRRVLKIGYERVTIRSCIHGGVPGKSIVSHARPHIDQHMVATLDVRKFYPSTKLSHLRPVLLALGFVEQAAEDLLKLVTLNGELPQGAPSSSLLANLSFAVADVEFIRLSRRYKLRYSRFVDDIALSGNFNLKQLRQQFIAAIGLANYEVAPTKIKFMGHNERQVVTGLVVNEKLRPTPEYLRRLKGDIRNCLQHGAQSIAHLDGLTVRQLKNQLTGRVAHVGSVDRAVGKKLRGMLCDVNWISTPNLAAR
jgi:RNA-directed DNA polymerase